MSMERQIENRKGVGAVHWSAWLAVLLIACVRVPQTTAFDKTAPRLVIDGYAFHARTVGSPDSPPVVILHGGPGGDMHYLESLSALGAHYYVLFYDQRGTGRSPREDPKTHTIARFLADLDGIVRAHAGARPVRLVGHSWGAMLATAYTARHPGRVSHLVASEPGILSPESARVFFPSVKQAQSLGVMVRSLPIFLTIPFVTSEDGHERMDYVLTKLMGLGRGPPYECEGEQVPDGSFVRGGYASFSSMIMPMMEDPSLWKWDLADGIERTKAKVLLLSSECSFIGYDYQEKHHRARFPKSARHVRLEKTGHNLFTMRGSAGRAVKIVDSFLE